MYIYPQSKSSTHIEYKREIKDGARQEGTWRDEGEGLETGGRERAREQKSKRAREGGRGIKR